VRSGSRSDWPFPGVTAGALTCLSDKQHTHAGKPYVRFVLVKENRESNDVLGEISRRLHTPVKHFAVAGTKVRHMRACCSDDEGTREQDKRGVTVQRATVHRVQAQRLASVNANVSSVFVRAMHQQRKGRFVVCVWATLNTSPMRCSLASMARVASVCVL
jgi:hypothetical protein